MPDFRDKPIAFGRHAADRIVDAVKRVETTVSGHTQNYKPRAFPGAGAGVVEAVVTTAIPAFNTNTNSYGVGAAQIFIDNVNGIAVIDPAYSTYNSNTNTTTNAPVTVLNWLTGTNTIAVNTHILIAPRNGNYRLITGDCP